MPSWGVRGPREPGVPPLHVVEKPSGEVVRRVGIVMGARDSLDSLETALPRSRIDRAAMSGSGRLWVQVEPYPLGRWRLRWSHLRGGRWPFVLPCPPSVGTF